MRVIHVVRDLDVASGGPSRSVPALAEHQARTGVGVTVLFRDRGNPIVPLPLSAVAFRPISGGASSQLTLASDNSSGETLFHLHGLWDPLLHRSAQHARRQRLPYVVSTRGMLAGWALGHKAWKKKLAWRLYQKKDLQAAACLVASSEFEQRDVVAQLPGCRVEVIPNGVEAPLQAPPVSDLLPNATEARWALAMGRLHPVKGYAELIEAWAAVRPAAWRLAIAGPDEDGYRARLEELIVGHGLGDRVLLIGAVDDARKWALLEQCELFLAPSRTENFGMAIAEALQSGTPVLTTTGTPWRELAERDCGWWVAPDAAGLEAALAEATRREEDVLQGMGERGRHLVGERYSWEPVAARTIELYESILTRSAAGKNAL